MKSTLLWTLGQNRSPVVPISLSPTSSTWYTQKCPQITTPWVRMGTRGHAVPWHTSRVQSERCAHAHVCMLLCVYIHILHFKTWEIRLKDTLQSRVFNPWHYLHLGPGHSLGWGGLSCVLQDPQQHPRVSPHEMPGTSPPTLQLQQPKVSPDTARCPPENTTAQLRTAALSYPKSPDGVWSDTI